MNNMPFDMFISSTLELIQITGCPNLFEEKKDIVTVHNYIGKLPCDYYDMKQVIVLNNAVKDVESINMQDPGRVMKLATGTFEPLGNNRNNDLTYKIVGNAIHVSLRDCMLLIGYTSIVIDNDGYPMIINNASFIRALKSYIKMVWFEILYENDELGKNGNNILASVQQDYYGNIAQAQSSLLDMTPERAEVISRILNDTLVRQNEHANMYRDLNKEHTIQVKR